MRKAAILALAAVMVLPAAAAEKTEGQAKKGRPGTNVDMPFLMAPLIGPDGKLTGYAYIASRLTATSEVFAVAVRDKLPFIQDVFVRDVNAAAVTVPGDPEKVDIAGVEERLLADARKVMGAGKVKLMTVCTVQIAELHLGQPPAHSSPPQEKSAPDAPPPKNPTVSRCES